MKRTVDSPAQQRASIVRRRVWRHNGFQGTATFINKACGSMLLSDSLTPAARLLAEEMQKLSSKLSSALKERHDP